MTKTYRQLSLLLLPLIMLVFMPVRTQAQCPVLPSYSFVNTCLADYEVSFANTSTAPGGQIASYYWDFGDGNNSTATNPVHVFPGAGTYTVYLFVYDTSNCYDSIAHNVTAAQLPVANFSWDANCAGSLIQFSDLTVSPNDPPVAWIWDFGDGNASALQNPTHIYASGGAFPVSLTVTTAGGCTDVQTLMVPIDFPPVADFSFSLSCWGSPTTFTDESYGIGPATIISWAWDFGDGNTSTAQNPVYNYAVAGNYTVSLTVTDDNNCSSTSTKTVSVYIPPIANWMATDACEGFPTAFTDLSIGIPLPITSWAWDFGDGFSSNSQHPTHLFGGPGTYNVTLTVTNQVGCSDAYADNVTVYENPEAEFTADTACLGYSTHFTDLSIPVGQIVSWSWNFGDPASGSANVSFLQNPSHTYTSSGSYSVSLTVTDVRGCTNIVQHNVWVEPLPVANFSYINESCVGEEVYFLDISVPGNANIISWTWNFGDGNIVTINAPNNPSINHTYNSAGLYSVKLDVVSELGCMGSVTKTVNIVPAPTANFIYSWACEGMQTQFNDASSYNGGSAPINWWWDFGDPMSGGANNSFFQDPQHVFSGPGSYIVSLIVYNADFCSDTVFKTVIVHSKPPADFYYDAACEGDITQFYTDETVVNVNATIGYLWDFDDGVFSNLKNPPHLFPGAGTYEVTLTITDTALCEGSVSHFVVVDEKPIAFFDVTEPTCQGDSVWFDDLSSTTYGFIQMWVWHYDDGTPNDTIIFPDDPNVYHVYSNTGSYMPTLTVVNSQGCSHLFSRIIEIDGKPIANFHWSANACEGEEVQFTDNSFANGQGNIITWNWEFDDPLSGANNTSVQQNPIHVFSGGGTYFVSLIVTNFNNCRDTIIKPVQVNESPLVDFYYENPCEDTLTYFFPDASVMNVSGVVNWLWEFGDGQVSTAQAPAHDYEVSGYYDVTLTIVDTGLCTSSFTQQIFINASPQVLFDISDVTCEQNPVYFDDLSSVANSFIVEWTWDFGDGTDTTIYFPDDPDVSHTYALDGVYEVTLSVVSEDTCYATGSQFLTIDPAPIALFDFDISCSDTATQFWDNSSHGGGAPISQWYWDFGDPGSGASNNSSMQDPVHVFSDPGIYDVTLTVTNIEGCMDDIINQVVVNQAAPVDFYSVDTCLNYFTQFYVDTASSDTAAILVYDWDFGDGSPHSSQMNPSHMYAGAGIYMVTLIIADTSGCFSIAQHEAEVRENPVALFEYETACTNDSTYFADESYTLGGEFIVAWEWDFGDPASGAANYSNLQDPAHLFTDNEVFEVQLVITSEFGCRDSITLPVTVYQGPVADYDFSVESCNEGLVYFSDESMASQTVIVEWEWYFEPGAYSYIPNPMHTFQVTDTTYLVSLTVTDANGCKSTMEKDVFVPNAFEIEMENTQTCDGLPMHFNTVLLDPPNDSIFSYAWNFGDPASGPYNFSSLPTPSHIFTGSGYFTITLTAIDINGCPVTIYDQVFVDGLPEPDFTATLYPCDSIISFADNSFGNGATIQSWLWDFGDGTPPVLITDPPGNIDHFFALEGTYDVTLTVINGLGCENTITKSVEMMPCVNSSFFVLNSPVCERHMIYFSDSSELLSVIEEWHWYFGDGSDTVYYNKADVIGHRYNTGGDFTVTLIVKALFNAEEITDTMTREVEVRPTPETDFYTENVCLGETTYFFDSTEHSGFYLESWRWNFGTGDPGDTSILKNPEFKYDTAGQYEVYLITKNQFGCFDTAFQEVEVYHNPIADFEYSLPCETDPIYFTDLSDGFDEDVIKWDWFFNDPFKSGDSSDARHPQWVYAYAGTYSPSLVITNAHGCKDTVSHDVEVNTVPTAAFDMVGNTDNMQGSIELFDQSSSDAIEYHWTYGDGYENWGNTPPITHVYEEEGAYDIELVVWNDFGCSDTSDSYFEFMFKTLFIPNALCPECNDENVQVFQPVGRNLLYYHIEIHDNWGTLIWESDKLDPYGRPVESWDGTYNKELLPGDVYIWMATATFRDGTIWEGTVVGNTTGTSGSTSGTVTLVR